MRRIIFLTTIFVLLIFVSFGCKGRGSQMSREERGKFLYDAHCASCHGLKGDGKGPTALSLWPKPRDLTLGILKYRTTSGPIPDDLDILQTIKKGVPGTSMPGWDMLGNDDWRALLAYIKQLAPSLQAGKPGPPIDIPAEALETPQSIEAGRKLYARAGCATCHGGEGHGDGPARTTLKDIWGDDISPRDLTHGPLKWGNTKKDIYRTIMMGVPGTPMPAFGQAMSHDELWQLTHFVKSIQTMPPEYDPSDPKRNLIKVHVFNGPVPLDTEADVWKNIKAVPVFLHPLLHDDRATEWLMVKALHTKDEIAFLISWEDDQANVQGTVDAVALQFPIAKIADPSDLPYLGMGSDERPVQLWKWSPGGVAKISAMGLGSTVASEVQGAEKEVVGNGIYRDGNWSIIVKRSLVAKGKEEIYFDRTGYLSFALWDADLQKQRGPESFSEWLMYELE